MRGVRALPIALCFAVAACGSTPEERGITGAGLASAGGAVIGVLTGVSILDGALVGAAVGGLVGALTDADDFNLGDPIWKKDSPPKPGSQKAASTQVVKADPTSLAPDGGAGLVVQIQQRLAALGYDTGPQDGKMGPKTAAAISQYQHDHALLVDGRPSTQLLGHMRRSVKQA